MASWIKDKATLTYDRGNGTDKFFGRVMCTPYGDEGEFTEAPLSGTMTHHTGDVYVGTFHTERRHGFGKLTFKNEDVYVGTWAHGALVGEGTFKLSACGTQFGGLFGLPRSSSDETVPALVETMLYRGVSSANGLKPVSASVFAAKGTLYEHAGYLTGKGTIEYRDGRVFTGSFVSGEPTEDGEHSLEIPVPEDSRKRNRCELSSTARHSSHSLIAPTIPRIRASRALAAGRSQVRRRALAAGLSSRRRQALVRRWQYIRGPISARQAARARQV